MIIDWLVRTVSFFNTILLFWLGLMVILSGNRKSIGTWMVGGGLLVGTVFFVSHSMIMGGDISRYSFGLNFWWMVSWIPAVAAPLAWYGAMLWYAGFDWRKAHPHRKYLVVIFFLVLVMTVQVVIWNPIPSYSLMMSRLFPQIESNIIGLPLIVFTYLVLSVLCYMLPLDLLGRNLFNDRPLAAAAFRKARLWLMMASVALLLASLVMVWTALWILESQPTPSLTRPEDVLNVKRLDLIVSGLVGVGVIILGRAIVAYEVFTGVPLPRNRFSRQWRSTVILAGAYASVVSFGITIHLPLLYIVMTVTLLFILFYSLYSWRSYIERDTIISGVRPLLTSGDIFSQVIDSEHVNFDGPENFFSTLCQDILSVPTAAIRPAPWVAPLVKDALVFNPFKKPFDYSLPEGGFELFNKDGPYILPGEGQGVVWMVSLWRKSDLIGVLFLGEKADGNPFTEEEIDIAQLGGERLLDMLAGTEMARVAIALLQERLSEMTVLEAKSRRVLHDDILPEIHTAVLRLRAESMPGNVESVVASLSKTHHMISDLIRNSPPTVPERLSTQGLITVIKNFVESDYKQSFSTVFWEITPDVDQHFADLTDVSREVIYFAVQELLRNAAKYANGGNLDHPVQLWIRFMLADRQMIIEVQDDGVGLSESVQVSSGGNGLRFHAAMLAVVGGRLEINSQIDEGTTATIKLPKSE